MEICRDNNDNKEREHKQQLRRVTESYQRLIRLKKRRKAIGDSKELWALVRNSVHEVDMLWYASSRTARIWASCVQSTYPDLGGKAPSFLRAILPTDLVQNGAGQQATNALLLVAAMARCYVLLYPICIEEELSSFNVKHMQPYVSLQACRTLSTQAFNSILYAPTIDAVLNWHGSGNPIGSGIAPATKKRNSSAALSSRRSVRRRYSM